MKRMKNKEEKERYYKDRYMDDDELRRKRESISQIFDKLVL